MGNYEQDIFDRMVQEAGIDETQADIVHSAILAISECRVEEAVSEMEYPSISDYVADNFARDILNEMDYSDIHQYVTECEQTKESDSYDYRTEG